MIELTKEHVAQAYARAGTYARRRWSHLRDEFEGAALEGLAKAARTYDPDTNVPFEIWARNHVDWAIRDARRAWTGRWFQRPEAAAEDLSDIIAETQPSYPDDVERAIVAREQLARVMELTPRERAAISAHVAGRPHIELAEEWGVTESRVSQILATARRRLAAA